MAPSIIRHKHVRIDQAKLQKAKRILGAKTDTEALDRTLTLVVGEWATDETLRKVRGKGGLKKTSIDMRRLVIDTGIYVDWINVGRHEEVLFERGAVKYMSAVVLMELRAGAFSTPDLRRLRNIGTSFKKAGRVPVPTALACAEAGEVLRVLQSERGLQHQGRSLDC